MPVSVGRARIEFGDVSDERVRVEIPHDLSLAVSLIVMTLSVEEVKPVGARAFWLVNDTIDGGEH
jgi:hypothetical protein